MGTDDGQRRAERMPQVAQTTAHVAVAAGQIGALGNVQGVADGHGDGAAERRVADDLPHPLMSGIEHGLDADARHLAHAISDLDQPGDAGDAGGHGLVAPGVAAVFEAPSHQAGVARLVAVHSLGSDQHRLGIGFLQETVDIGVPPRRSELACERLRAPGILVPQRDQLQRRVGQGGQKVAKRVTGGAQKGGAQPARRLMSEAQRTHTGETLSPERDCCKARRLSGFSAVAHPGRRRAGSVVVLYQEDRAQRYPIRLLVRGYSYKLFGLFESDLHLFGTGVDGVPVHLFGTDSLGRDVFSRTLYGSQISLSVGLVGVAISFFLGILIGGVAGFFGGTVDEVIQRLIEIIISIPPLPLWMGLSAALPTGWPVGKMYFAITVIVSLIGWTSLARVVRGKFLSLREEDFVVAAKLAGRRDVPTIFLHMVPSFLSHIIASLTLAIPTMILAETALSFLGLGMQPPAMSWGVLLKAAQNVHSIALAPWLMIPGLFVIVTVLAFNFVGDGLRDAADPYASH